MFVDELVFSRYREREREKGRKSEERKLRRGEKTSEALYLWGRFVTSWYFRLHDSFDDCFGVLETGEHLLAATVSFDECKFERSVVAFFVYVRHGAHYRTNDYFRVIVEKVYLEKHKNFINYLAFRSKYGSLKVIYFLPIIGT